MQKSVGVIVGRFQVDELHDGHRDLIDFVLSKHDRVIIFLGLSPIKCSANNPLDFEARKQMISKEYPDITILYIKDTSSDYVWSDRLDEMIGDITGPNQDAVLYGSRDSFIKHYFGKYGTVEYRQHVFISGTEIRKKISSKVKASSDFRKGVIWATENQWSEPKPTVDVALLDDDNSHILLGKKKDENGYRFIGGFVAAGNTWEETAIREVKEETNLTVNGLEYIGSYFIDCWRFKYETDKITTTFFKATIGEGKPKPDDDIYELRLYKTANFIEDMENILVSEHMVLGRALIDYLRKTVDA